MHTSRRWLRAALIMTSTVSSVSAAPMTAGERQRLLAHFDMTNAWLASELAGLSDAQLNFRMTPDSWSIKNVVEHLAIAEPQDWPQLQDGLSQPLGYASESTTDAAISLLR